MCDDCGEILCSVCFQVLHRKGNRRNHTFHFRPKKNECDLTSSLPLNFVRKTLWLPALIKEKSSISFVDRAKYIPVRLRLAERKLLRLLGAALQVIRYTDVVDSNTFRNPVSLFSSLDVCVLSVEMFVGGFCFDLFLIEVYFLFPIFSRFSICPVLI